MLISQTDLPTNVTTLYTYDKAGRKIKVTNTKQKVEYQFGKSYNSNTGLNNYGFRDYSSSIGRFITSDPIRDGTNWYTLAVNNPINFVDLWGLCTQDTKIPNGMVDPDQFSPRIDEIINYTNEFWDVKDNHYVVMNRYLGRPQEINRGSITLGKKNKILSLIK